MRILLNAYACEPYKGSEPGIGWKWSLELALNTNNKIYVLTRSNNKKCIENYFLTYKKPNNLYFFYYDLPNMFVWLKRHGLPVNLYYSMWLYGAGIYAKELHKSYHFDVAHHITFGVFRDAPFLYKLGIPYMIGPLGGGEMAPKSLYSFFSAIPLIKEYIREFINKTSLVNPFLIKSFNNANIVFTKTLDTKMLIKKWSHKTNVKLELGIDNIPNAENLITRKRDDTFLFVGRFVSWKGTDLVLHSFNYYLKNYDNDSKLIMIGKGDNLNKIKSYIKENKLESRVTIIPWIEQSKLKDYYTSCKVLLFPSMHDSSGNVVLEALSYGMPVISLDCGGPATILGQQLNEMIVTTKNKNKEEIIQSIVDKMHKLITNKEFYNKIQIESLERSKDFLWSKVINDTYNLFLDTIKK